MQIDEIHLDWMNMLKNTEPNFTTKSQIKHLTGFDHRRIEGGKYSIFFEACLQY